MVLGARHSLQKATIPNHLFQNCSSRHQWRSLHFRTLRRGHWWRSHRRCLGIRNPSLCCCGFAAQLAQTTSRRCPLGQWHGAIWQCRISTRFRGERGSDFSRLIRFWGLRYKELRIQQVRERSLSCLVGNMLDHLVQRISRILVVGSCWIIIRLVFFCPPPVDFSSPSVCLSRIGNLICDSGEFCNDFYYESIFHGIICMAMSDIAEPFGRHHLIREESGIVVREQEGLLNQFR